MEWCGIGGTLKRNGSDTDDPYRSYGCRRLTEGAGRLLTRTRHFGLTATVAAALSTPPSTTRASWTRGRKGGGGCSSIKDKEDDDDKDDDQDTKKQHSIKWGHFVSPHPTGDASVPRTPMGTLRFPIPLSLEECVYLYILPLEKTCIYTSLLAMGELEPASRERGRGGAGDACVSRGVWVSRLHPSA